MIKVVIDTNVFVSSFFGGNPRAVIDVWTNGKATLCLSKDIVDEYIAVFERLGLDRDREIKEILRLFAAGFQIVFCHKTPHLEIIEDDPGDDKFIECAVALEAQYIISGDKHILSVQDYMGIQIMTPAQFLKSS